MKLREIAFSRSGDKGNTANICVFPYDEAQWPVLVEHLTADVVAAKFRGLVAGEVLRYEMPGSKGLNFVLHEALGGGVSISLRLDPHGKAYQSLMLDIDLPIDAEAHGW